MSDRALPLNGLRVVDAAHVIAGPGIATRLSDFGADVIKVEHPRQGDTTRSLGWASNEATLWWKHLGRNKRSITLDLSHPEAQRAFTELVKKSDILVESFRPGTMERWNLGPDRLLATNKNLIYVRVSGFGQTGPAASKPGFGTLAEALSGFVHMSGFPTHPPTLPPIALADEVAALLGAFAVMVAVYYRDLRGGPGQVIDIALTESLLQLLGPVPLAYDLLGEVPERIGNRLAYAAPRGAYEAKDGRWIALSGTSQSVAMRILQLIGGDDLANDPRFATNQARLENIDELDKLIAEWVGKRDRDDALAEFERKDVAAAPIYNIAEVFSDPQYQARDAVITVEDPDIGTARTVAPQPRMSLTPPIISHLGRPLGADTETVLKELGYKDPNIADLREQGVI